MPREVMIWREIPGLFDRCLTGSDRYRGVVVKLSCHNIIPTPESAMRKKALLKIASYSPENFLNRLLGKMQLKNDAALARVLEVTPAVVSRIRNKRVPVSANLLLMIHETTEIAIPELRRMMGDSRRLFS